MSENERPGTDLLDLAYPYAMDAVAELERRTIEHRLRDADPGTVDAFATIVSGVRETLAALTVLDAIEPPPALEATLLAALGEVPAEKKRGLGRLRWVAAAAAVAVVVGVGAGVLAQRTNEPAPQQLTAQMVLEQPDVVVRSVPVASGGRLVVYTSARLGAASASFEDVVAPPQGSSYQLWLAAADGSYTHSAAVLTALPATGAALVTRFDAVDILAVTVEPATGSPKPTGDAIASVNLA